MLEHPLVQVCYQCLATKGNSDFRYVYTNLHPTALWRLDNNVPPAWQTAPAMSFLQEFSCGSIALDLLHIFHLGVLRDLLGSGFKLVCQRRHEFYSGRNIAVRLAQLSRELKSWVATNKLYLSLKRIHKKTLLWTGNACLELRSKGADALVCLRFLSHKLQLQATEQFPSLAACVWAAECFIGVLAHSSLFMLSEESQTAYRMGILFTETYMSLASAAVLGGQFYFKVRPKFHFLVHLIDSLCPSDTYPCRNPFADATFADEDYVKHLLTCHKKMARKTASENILKRFLVMNKMRLDAFEQ